MENNPSDLQFFHVIQNFLLLIVVVSARTALDELCRRMPSFHGCQQRPVGSSSSSSSNAAHGVPAPQMVGQPVRTAAFDQINCKSQESKYFFECTRHNPFVTGETLDFCHKYAGQCGLLHIEPTTTTLAHHNEQDSSRGGTETPYASADAIAGLCYEYKSKADSICTGFELKRDRIDCNYYRVYCQGKKPFPLIEGNVANIDTDWGLGGIPFYPMNREGKVSGGSGTNVAFGDWGAKTVQNAGVRDFYEQKTSKVVQWQEGTYDSGTTSWKVPVAGIGGFSGGVLQLGGLLNPSEMRDMLNGGVKEPGPPFHRFTVELKKMLNIDDEKETTKESRRRIRRRRALIQRFF